MEDKVISWQAPEFEHHEKEVFWSWASIVFAIIILTSAILNRNFLFAIFIVIAEVLILIWGNRRPREVLFELDKHELVIDKRERHLLKTLDHFGVIELGEEEKYLELGLAFNRLRPMMRILLPRDIAKPVEQKLKLYGRRVDMEPTVVDTIERLLKF